MGTSMLFYVIAMNVLFLRSEGAVYSSSNTALKFSQCLIEKIGESPFFTVRERNNMVEVADVLAETMQKKLPGIASPIRVLTTAFITSIADVVILEDSTTNFLRKEVYSDALKQCSISSTGYIDSEFIADALHIMTTLENSKIASAVKDSAFSPSYSGEQFEPGLSEDDFESDFPISEEDFEPTSYEPSEMFDFHAVQPSPVDIPNNPSRANFNPNSEMPKSSFQVSGIPSVSQSNVNFRLSVQPKSRLNSPSRFHSPGIFNSRRVASTSVISQGNISPNLRNHGRPSSTEFRGLSIPQRKESKVLAIAPLDIPEVGKVPFRDQSVPKTNEDSIKQSEFPSHKKSFPMTSSTPLPQTKVQEPVAFNNPLENIICNVLSNSPEFRNAFHFGINQERALNLAEAITNQSLSYNEDMATEAMIAVSDAILEASFTTPMDYARAIAKSLSSVLKNNNMTLFVDGARTASDFLAKLPDRKHMFQPVVPNNDGTNSSASLISSKWEPEQPPFDFETPTNAPEDVNGEIFEFILQQYLKESPEIASLFCNTHFSSNVIQMCFSIIKSSLAEYEDGISEIAANIISGNMEELSPYEMCSEYPQIISKGIAEILDENRLLNSADPDELFQKILLNFKEMQKRKEQSGQQQSIYNETKNFDSKDTGNSFTQSAPSLQPSFSSISNKYKEESIIIPLKLNQTSAANDSPTASEFYTTPVSDLSDVIEQEETTEKPFTSVSIPTSISPSNEQVAEFEEEDLDILITAINSDITDEELTSTSSVTDLITSTLEPTSSTLSSTDYETEKYEDIALMLLHKLESALDDDSDCTEISTESTIQLTPSENDKSVVTEVTTESEESSEMPPEIPSENNPERSKDTLHSEHTERNKRNMKMNPITGQMDLIQASDDRVDKDGEEDYIIPPSTLTRPSNSHQKSGSNRRIRFPNRSGSSIQSENIPSYDPMYFPLRILSGETDDSIYQNNPKRNKNFRRQPASSVDNIQDFDGGSLLSRRVLSTTDYTTSYGKTIRRPPPERFATIHKIQQQDVYPEETVSTDSTTVSSVYLQPSFQEPALSNSFRSGKMNGMRTNPHSFNLYKSRNPSRGIERVVSQIATSSINYIRSDNFNFYELCIRLNKLADIVNIPPLDYCDTIPLMDFLLHVLKSVTNSQNSF